MNQKKNEFNSTTFNTYLSMQETVLFDYCDVFFHSLLKFQFFLMDNVCCVSCHAVGLYYCIYRRYIYIIRSKLKRWIQTESLDACAVSFACFQTLSSSIHKRKRKKLSEYRIYTAPSSLFATSNLASFLGVWVKQKNGKAASSIKKMACGSTHSLHNSHRYYVRIWNRINMEITQHETNCERIPAGSSDIRTFEYTIHVTLIYVLCVLCGNKIRL